MYLLLSAQKAKTASVHQIHSSNAQNDCNYTGVETGAWDSTWVSQVACKDLTNHLSHCCCFPKGCTSRKLEPGTGAQSGIQGLGCRHLTGIFKDRSNTCPCYFHFQRHRERNSGKFKLLFSKSQLFHCKQMLGGRGSASQAWWRPHPSCFCWRSGSTAARTLAQPTIWIPSFTF